MAVATTAFWLKITFAVLGCVMVATLIYTISVDGSPFRTELLTPWMKTTLLDFYINVFALAAWVSFKESSWISAIIWVTLLVGFGSATTCAYIVSQCLKLSSVEASEDAIYHVLLPPRNKDGIGQRQKFSSVLTAQILFSALGCLMVCALVYTMWTDGSPFRMELLTPWMMALLIDFYINVGALSVWVAYKEANWLSAVIWILLLIGFGSITTCAYITYHLFGLSVQDPVYFVLLSGATRQVRKPCSSEYKQKL